MVEKFVTRSATYVQEHLPVLLAYPPQEVKAPLLMRWNNEVKEARAKRLRELKESREAFTRTQSLVLSYMLIASGVEKVEMLSIQISLWNTSRALAMALWIFLFESPDAMIAIGHWIHGKRLANLTSAILESLVIVFLSTALVANAAYER